MAKELVFKLSGKDYNAAPVKLERKKIYGWTDTIATDRSGDVCGSAYLSPDNALIIPSATNIGNSINRITCLGTYHYTLFIL